MFSKEEIDNYRAAVLQAMITQTDANGNPIIGESEAQTLLKGFTDDELSDGMPFNTADEMADMLLTD